MSKKRGMPSGSLVHVGEQKMKDTKITLMDFTEDHFEDVKVKDIEECKKYKDKATTTWINIDGLHDIEKIEELGGFYGLHPLLMEDILNTYQRPKYEEFEDHLFLVFKMVYLDIKKRHIIREQVSVVIGENFILTFQEKSGDVFDPIRNRIKKEGSRIRGNKADFLAYTLIDAVVDNYFVVLEEFGERIENIESELIDNPEQETLYKIHNTKRDMITLRKSVWPLREVINGFLREDSPLIRDSTKIYLRDLYDHTIQVVDTIETNRDILSGLLDLYLSSISNRMNEVMKVLTIIATIFIPLTFVAGIYGMNFDPDASPLNMPELGWYFGYPITIFVMLIIAVVMVIYFRRKKWL
ncbi:MAG: magnesium/cobalt transporter CorA [Candidatus Saliniplasma sp.]